MSKPGRHHFGNTAKEWLAFSDRLREERTSAELIKLCLASFYALSRWLRFHVVLHIAAWAERPFRSLGDFRVEAAERAANTPAEKLLAEVDALFWRMTPDQKRATLERLSKLTLSDEDIAYRAQLKGNIDGQKIRHAASPRFDETARNRNDLRSATGQNRRRTRG